MLEWLKMLKVYKNNVSKLSFVSKKLFSKNFVAIHEMKPIEF